MLAPISRDAEAQRIVNKYTGWGAGSGVVPVPGLDVAAIGTVQVLMVRDLLHLYERPFHESRARTVVTLLVGSLSPSALAGVTALTFFKFVPVLGYPLAAMAMPLLTSAATYAVGQAMVKHLRDGGTLETLTVKDLRQELRSAYDDFRKQSSNMPTTPQAV